MERGYGSLWELNEDEIEQALRRIHEYPVINVQMVEVRDR